MLVLGCTCVRDLLYTNYLIVAKVSALGKKLLKLFWFLLLKINFKFTEVMLLAGLYISSLSSSLGTFYGTPRVLQSIASQKVIPFIRFMAKGVRINP